jgi:hypothetical protein
VSGLVRAPAIEEGKGSPAVEPLTRGTIDLSITDRPATPYHRLDPLSPTPEEENPNPNGSSSDSPPQLSPLGNHIIRWVMQLPTSTRTRPAARSPGCLHQRTSFRQHGVVSLVLPLRTSRWGGGEGGEDGGPLHRASRVVAVVGGTRWVS